MWGTPTRNKFLKEHIEDGSCLSSTMKQRKNSIKPHWLVHTDQNDRAQDTNQMILDPGLIYRTYR